MGYTKLQASQLSALQMRWKKPKVSQRSKIIKEYAYFLLLIHQPQYLAFVHVYSALNWKVAEKDNVRTRKTIRSFGFCFCSAEAWN